MKNDYFLTAFKIAGHRTWRVHLGREKLSFDKEAKINNFPAITEKRQYRLDCETGEFSLSNNPKSV